MLRAPPAPGCSPPTRRSWGAAKLPLEAALLPRGLCPKVAHFLLPHAQDMPNNYDRCMADLGPEEVANDLKHGMGRIIKTFMNNVKPMFSEMCGMLLSSCFLVINQASMDEIKSRLMAPAGSPQGLKVGGRFTKVAARLRKSQ